MPWDSPRDPRYPKGSPPTGSRTLETPDITTAAHPWDSSREHCHPKGSPPIGQPPDVEPAGKSVPSAGRYGQDAPTNIALLRHSYRDREYASAPDVVFHVSSHCAHCHKHKQTLAGTHHTLLPPPRVHELWLARFAHHCCLVFVCAGRVISCGCVPYSATYCARVMNIGSRDD